MTDNKIDVQHLSRKAIVYVRQSSARQLRHNAESRRLQYAVQDRVRELGWDQVEVIDEDLGRSAAGTVEREGFKRMVADVGLGEVGAVAAREMSRFARNSRDWQQLMEMCRMVDTLLIDHDTVYDTRNGNDRLLLGLKGTVNEYELHLLRQRAHEALQLKVRRGEHVSRVPVGYCRTDEETLEKHPDRRIRQTIELLFDKVFELGSARQLLVWLLENDLQLPRGVKGTQVVWKPANYSLVISILKNPAYAGAYAHGRRVRKRWVDSEGRFRTTAVWTDPEKWVLLKDRHEGYISWERYEQLQAMIERNAQSRRGVAPGAAKSGCALLAGLLRCKRCGHKLHINYSGERGDVHRYQCSRGQYSARRCISFSGMDVDDRVSAEILGVVRPAAVQAARLAAEQAARSDDEVLQALRTELQAARHAADRACRQYEAVDPGNRLVADELERRWNDALEKVVQLEERIEARQQQRRAPPSAEQFEHLAIDLDRVWNDPEVDVRLKKRIVRTLIEEILADVDERSREINLLIHWKGGVHSTLSVKKRHRGDKRVRTPVEVVEVVRELTRICNDATIARWLSRAGLVSARGFTWTASLVASLRHRHGIASHNPERQRAEGWMSKKDAAHLLGVSQLTIKRAVDRGKLSASHPLPNGPWIFKQADVERSELAAELRRRPQADAGCETLVDRQLDLVITDT
jgi:DNA invertase Pin-like site-specific DNA recombinase